MVGKRVEHAGIAKEGAKMVNAVATATVPKFTVIIGGSFGAGNYAMCGRAYEPRMIWMWPNARISVMGGEQAASVLATVKADSMQERGETWPDAERAKYEAGIRADYDPRGIPTIRAHACGTTASSIRWTRVRYYRSHFRPQETDPVMRKLPPGFSGCSRRTAP